MKIARNLWCALMFALSVPLSMPVQAAVLTNFTDQWWSPSESGWGASVLQQGDVMFIDLFVYDTNSNPVWYTATAVYQGQTGSGDLVFAGDLIATTGSYFGAAVFTPGAVTRQKVGTITFDAASATLAKLTYSVNGVTVVKNISRQPLQSQDFSGSYFGGFAYNASGCAGGAVNGPSNQFSTLSISQTGTSVSIFSANINGGSCNYSGTYSQDGHLGTITGTFSCSNGDTGPFTAADIEVTLAGFNGQFTGQNQKCTKLEGQFGGVRNSN